MNVRSLLAPLVAVALAIPAIATAQAPAQALSIGGFVGYETGDLDGIQLRAEAELPYRQLTPEIGLSWVGSLGYSRLSDEAFGVEIVANLVKAVPTARFTLPVNPQLSLFGDAGLGLYYASISTEFSTPFFGQQSASDSSFGLMLRLGVGAFFQLNERTRIGGGLQLDPMFGDYDDSTFTIQVGLSYRM
jgi:opacity protein-like surface antigen